MQITIHRGTDEVGGTMIELNTGKTRILLDAGYPLFYRGELILDEWTKKTYQELLELGVILEVKGLYRWDGVGFDAVLISHAHSDHFGLLQYIHPDIPIYRSETTDKLIEKNLAFPIRGFSTCCLHTSGHAFEGDIKKVITGLSPKEIVPIHTFCPEAFLTFHDHVTLRRDGVPFPL